MLQLLLPPSDKENAFFNQGQVIKKINKEIKKSESVILYP